MVSTPLALREADRNPENGGGKAGYGTYDQGRSSSGVEEEKFYFERQFRVYRV